jgi:hypothetical protein
VICSLPGRPGGEASRLESSEIFGVSASVPWVETHVDPQKRPLAHREAAVSIVLMLIKLSSW